MGLLFFTGCTPNKIFLQSEATQVELDSYLQKLAESEDHYLIDVRTPMEYKKGHLDGAINISFLSFKFSKRIEQLDTSKTVFLYCQTAHRSPYAAKKLKKKGFGRIVDLKGGYQMVKKQNKITK